MKLVSYRYNEGQGSGVLPGEMIQPLSGGSLLEFVASGRDEPSLTEEKISLFDVTLTAPLNAPPRIFGIGLNYVEHAAKAKMKLQAVPTVFLKLQS